MICFESGGKKISLFKAKEQSAPVIYLNTVSSEAKDVYGRLSSITMRPFSLVAIGNLDWTRDMVPWSHDAIASNAMPFIGGADDYLGILTSAIIPDVEKRIGKVGERIIAGYSLAGLFALYSLYKSDCFQLSASVSSSLWFPGFKEFALSHDFSPGVKKVYFSIGDKESNTTNPYLRKTEDITRQVEEHFRKSGIKTVFTLNKGNHYKNASGRLANALSWLLD